jgi:hypothetical protein
MTRPASKHDLLAEFQDEYSALEQFLATLTSAEMLQPILATGWSPKDYLAHLYEWQQMFFTWYEGGLRGENPPTPAPGYKWGQLPALNQAIYERYRDLPLEDVLAKFRANHARTMALTESLSEADLFTPGLYPWMRSGILAGYLSANGGNHYLWARTDLQKALRPGRKKS